MSTSVLFRVSASVRSTLVLSPVSEVGSVLLNFFVASTTAGSRGLASETSLPCHRHPFCLRISLHGIRLRIEVEDDFVPIEDDPPVRSVSPASAIVGLSSVSFGGLPSRTTPCPSMAAPSHVSVKKHQHVDSEEVCGEFVQSLDHSQ